MVEPGAPAPDFTAPFVGAETEPSALSDRLGEGPVVLAFFPAAFSTTCTAELCTFRDDVGRFADLGATVFGISTDLPYALARFREATDLNFELVSDTDGSIIRSYDVVDSWPHRAIDRIARRSVFVLDRAGTVQYVWRADDPGQEPDYDAVADAVAARG